MAKEQKEVRQDKDPAADPEYNVIHYPEREVSNKPAADDQRKENPPVEKPQPQPEKPKK